MHIKNYSNKTYRRWTRRERRRYSKSNYITTGVVLYFSVIFIERIIFYLKEHLHLGGFNVGLAFSINQNLIFDTHFAASGRMMNETGGPSNYAEERKAPTYGSACAGHILKANFGDNYTGAVSFFRRYGIRWSRTGFGASGLVYLKFFSHFFKRLQCLSKIIYF